MKKSYKNRRDRYSEQRPKSESIASNRNLIVLAAVVAAGLALAPPARAACNNGCGSSGNTFLGTDAGMTGADNTAIGFDTLFSNTSGIQNTAIGSSALAANTVGYNNTAVGKTALQSNTTAIDNVAVGVAALQLNTTGNHNTATGLSALTRNSSGGDNTATGTSALYYNSNGNINTATGYNALQLNTSGSSNTATGANALFNTTGSNNIGVGESAGINLTTGSNNIAIGNGGAAAESNTIRIGVEGGTQGQTATYVSGIYSQVVFGQPKTVRVDNMGKLGTAMGSSARFKEAIKPMAKASEVILALKPVTFRYRHELDPSREPQFGLVAEQVEKVNPDLVERDAQGKPDTVRYEAVNAMLLNEFLKEHHKIEELTATVAMQRKQLEAFAVTMREQAATLEKVTARIALDHSSSKAVAARQ